jgi:hypothetical protein
MSRLIEADALKEPLIDEYKKLNDVFNETSVFKAPNDVALYGALMQEVGAVIGAIDALPTVDAVPVVRCKDCKWYGRVDKRRFYRGMDCLHKRICTIIPDKDYCSRAERKEE